MRIFLILFLTFSFNSFSQIDTLIYEVQDVEPEFPGGFDELLSWVQNSLLNETFTSEEASCLSSIFMEFVVEKDGSITNIKARNKCNSNLSHFEKLFIGSPKWEPGLRKGETVRSRYRLPLTINLN